MNINPFEILKNFGSIQSKMAEAQERLSSVRAMGCAGGDMVKIEMNGKFEVLSVTISPEAASGDDLDMLQDLVCSAMSDVLYKIKDAVRLEMSSFTGGLGINLPPGFMGM
jgi:DNA-binding YbaB/EbfC family protein